MPTPKIRRFLPFGPLCLLLALCACGGSSGGGGSDGGGGTTTLQPPSNLSVTWEPLFTFYHLECHWEPGLPSMDGFNLQGAENNGAFQALNKGLVPGDATWYDFDLDPSTPELTDFVFRVEAVKGAQTSAWAQVPFQLGILPPTNFNGYTENMLGTIHLTWTANSLVADNITLQRTASPPSGPSIVTTLAPPPFGTTAYDDTDLHENYEYHYHLTYNKGDLASSAADSFGIFYGLNAPENLAISTGASTANLTWALTSTQTTEIHIYRNTVAGATPSPAGILVTLPAGARQYTDTGLTQGLYSYEVASYEASTSAEEHSSWVTCCTQPALLDGQTLQAQYAAMGVADAVQPDPQGDWLLWPWSIGPQASGLEIWTPTVSTQQTYGQVGYLSDPPMLMDSGFQPHMAWVDGSGKLIHLWRTTTGWQTEMVATGVLPFLSQDGELSMPFLQAPDGTLHLFYGTSNPNLYVEAIRGTAGWTFQQDPKLASMCAFAMDPSGNLYGMQYGFSPDGAQPLFLCSRAADGTWTSQQVPGGGVLSPALFQADATGTLHFLFVKPADPGGPQGTVHYQWESGVWSQPEYLTSESPQILSGNHPMYLSICPDDQRLFFCSNFAEGTLLFARDPDGTWSSEPLLPASTYPPYFIQGLTASGKVYLVVWHGFSSGAVIFTEQ